MRSIRIRLMLPLALIALFVLTGMSRPLKYKSFQGKVKGAVPGVAVAGKIEGYLKENVNNQGCFSNDTLDAIVSVLVTNKTKQPIQIHGKQVVLVVNGKKYKSLASQYMRKGKKYVVPQKSFVVAPGKSARLVFNSYAFLPGKVLKTTDSIEAHVPVGKKTLILGFHGLRKVTVQNGYRRVLMPWGRAPSQ